MINILLVQCSLLYIHYKSILISAANTVDQVWAAKVDFNIKFVCGLDHSRALLGLWLPLEATAWSRCSCLYNVVYLLSSIMTAATGLKTLIKLAHSSSSKHYWLASVKEANAFSSSKKKGLKLSKSCLVLIANTPVAP